MSIANSPVEVVSDCALRVRFANHIRTDLPALIQSVCQQLQAMLGENLLDLIPSYTSLLIVLNTRTLDILSARQIVQKALTQAQPGKLAATTHQIPVYYAEETGLDLAELSEVKNLSIDQIIDLHSQTTYQVYAIGFSPAFAYLAEIPQQLATPRHATPRPHIAAGSVGIADRQTAIYPIDSPAGWRILGRTPLDLSLRRPENLTRFKVGDQVRFEPISRSMFQRLQQKHATV